jgi:hypothetical protein
MRHIAVSDADRRAARNVGATLHKGIWYFARYEDAYLQAFARKLDRIIPYGRGWAVQYRVSGPYLPEERGRIQA